MKKPMLISAILILFACLGMAQTPNSQTTVGVLHIATKGFQLDNKQMGNITRLELGKLNVFHVIDPFDADYLLNQSEISIPGCFGRICMVKAGKVLNADKMLTGSVEVLGEAIVVNLQLIDVAGENIEKSQVLEFLNIPDQVSTMINQTLAKMLGLAINKDVFNKLTLPFDYESSINNPQSERLNLSGPRMGAVVFLGELGRIWSDPTEVGGYDAFPLMSQFGYQFEVQYLTQGNFQALFEFIPLVTGLDQGFFIPSLTILNGLRNNKTGLEFAFGPTFSIAKKSDGYYDADDVWHRAHEWYEANPGEDNPYKEELRLDSRGEYYFNTGFVFAAGKTFKSGRLNIPVNVFFIPGKNNTHRVGLSMGFNSKK